MEFKFYLRINILFNARGVFCENDFLIYATTDVKKKKKQCSIYNRLNFKLAVESHDNNSNGFIRFRQGFYCVSSKHYATRRKLITHCVIKKNIARKQFPLVIMFYSHFDFKFLNFRNGRDTVSNGKLGKKDRYRRVLRSICIDVVNGKTILSLFINKICFD